MAMANTEVTDVNLLPKPVSSQRTNNEKMSTVCKNDERHRCSRSKRHQEKGAFILRFTVHKFKRLFHWKYVPFFSPDNSITIFECTDFYERFNQCVKKWWLHPNIVLMLIRDNGRKKKLYLDLVSLALGLCVGCNPVNSPDLCEHRAKAETCYRELLPKEFLVFLVNFYSCDWGAHPRENPRCRSQLGAAHTAGKR